MIFKKENSLFHMSKQSINTNQRKKIKKPKHNPSPGSMQMSYLDQSSLKFNSQVPTELEPVSLFQNNVEYNFLQRQFNELNLNHINKPMPSSKDPMEEESYLHFKYKELPMIFIEEDLTNMLKRVISQSKMKKAGKLRSLIEFFIKYLFNENEIDAMFFTMFSKKMGVFHTFPNQEFKTIEKRSLILETFCELLTQ